MAWIETIPESEATPELKDAYDQVVSSRGKLSNIMRIHSLNPPAMQAHFELYMSTVFGRLDLKRSDRELIATVVSAANDCRYCISHHAQALNHYWKDDDRIARVIDDYRSADLSEKLISMLDYCVKLTRTPSKVTEDDVENLRTAGYADKDILDINLITSYFNFVNRIALGLGVDFSEVDLVGYNY